MRGDDDGRQSVSQGGGREKTVEVSSAPKQETIEGKTKHARVDTSGKRGEEVEEEEGELEEVEGKKKKWWRKRKRARRSVCRL